MTTLLKSFRARILVVALLAGAPVFSVAAPASRESIEKLLELTDAKKAAEGLRQQAQSVGHGMLGQKLAKLTLAPTDQLQIPAARAQITAICNDKLSNSAIVALFVPIYEKTFTQEEVDGISAFYSSPAGKAYKNKMSAVSMSIQQVTKSALGPVYVSFEAVINTAVSKLSSKEKAPEKTH